MRKQLHILLVHQYFLEDGEGGGSRWNEMSRLWIEEGNDVTVLAGTRHYMSGHPTKTKGFSGSNKNKHGVSVIRCFASDPFKAGILGRILAYFSFTFSSIWAGLFHAREKYDVIIVTSPPLLVGITGLVLSWVKGVPLVFEVRDLWPESAIQMGKLSNPVLISVSFRLENYLYQKAEMVAVLTPAFQQILMDENNVDPQKIILISNGADFKYADEVMAKLDISAFRKQNNLENKFLIVYVGAHGEANQLIQILETAEILKETNVWFLLIGDGAEKQRLINAATERKLTNVQFMKSIPKSEVMKYVVAADMGASVLKDLDIFKTVYSNKTFDYFSCKTPVLMVIDGISRQLIEKIDAGIFVQPEKPQDFAAKILFCMGNQHLLRRQGENGYIYAKTHFDRVILAKKFLHHLAQIASKQ